MFSMTYVTNNSNSFLLFYTKFVEACLIGAAVHIYTIH
jgi:hypothetical protein